jgi:hypothetical protein
MVMGESTRRSSALDAEHVTAVLRQTGAEQLAGSAELLLVLDGMELRRAGANAQEHLMRVKDLDGGLVNGYRSFNVLGIGTDNKRGLLYHDLFSSQAPDFKSENAEIEQALAASEASVQHLAVPKTWVLDRGFDNDAHWWWVWDHTTSHLVWRVKHTGRIVLWCTPNGTWEERYLETTLEYAQHLASVETELEVCLRGQKRAKRQTVTVDLAAVSVRVYAPAAAGQKGGQRRSKDVWLVKVAVRNAVTEPWLLLTDWPVTDEASSVRIFRCYRMRWAVEDTFKFIKTAFGIEDVQMLKLKAVRTLVAFAWVAAGFLFQLGLTLDLPEVRLLARLGGWEERPNRPPGKLILTRGLSRILDMLATEAILNDYLAEHGELPPFVQHLLAKR